MTTAPESLGHYPGRPAIDAYGNGGFRFADMSHRGHLLFLPTGVFGSTTSDPDALAREALAMLIQQPTPQMVLLLGTGHKQVFPSPATRKLFAEVGIGLEAMTTGSACRTYNILLSEQRAVAAAVMAVE